MAEPNFNWDEENGVATCAIYDARLNKVFVGVAMCLPEDEEFKSEMTGCEIALARAQIKLLTEIRDSELKPSIKALKHLQGCMQQSPRFNKESYENQSLRREIRRLENLLATTNQELAEVKQGLKDYIEMKDHFYHILKERQNKDKLN